MIVDDIAPLCAGGGVPPTTYLAVFDGHGGDACAELLARGLHGRVAAAPSFDADPPAALAEAFAGMDAEVLDRFEAALASGVETEGSPYSGASALVVLVRADAGGALVLHTAAAGDALAVLCRAGGAAVPLNAAHVCSAPAEAERVRAAGGWVLDGRVNGTVAVTRAFGDIELKRLRGRGGREFSGDLLTAAPSCRSEVLAPGDEFLILASGAVWGALSPRQGVNFVRRALRDGGSGARLEEIARRLVERARSVGAPDSASAVIVRFGETG